MTIFRSYCDNIVFVVVLIVVVVVDDDDDGIFVIVAVVDIVVVINVVAVVAVVSIDGVIVNITFFRRTSFDQRFLFRLQQYRRDSYRITGKHKLSESLP